jgi:hypothetical protein
VGGSVVVVVVVVVVGVGGSVVVVVVAETVVAGVAASLWQAAATSPMASRRVRRCTRRGYRPWELTSKRGVCVPLSMVPIGVQRTNY